MQAIDTARPAAERSENGTKLSKLWPALLAILLGAFIIFAVGFAPGVAHNAAHDTRHTLLFPCH